MPTPSAPSAVSAQRASLLALPSFRWLWCAHLISQFGDGLYTVALPWLVYQHTRSGMATTATLAVSAGSFLVVGPLAGVFVDRWDRRRTLVCSDLLRALTLALFPLLLLAGFNLGVVLAMAVLLPAFGRFFVPAQRASIPGLVPAESLVSANAQMQSAGSAAYIAGPAAAGVLIVSLGAAPLLLLDGLTFVASALLLSLVVFPPRCAAPVARSVRADLAEGFRITWRVPALRASCLLALFGTVFFAPVPALLPLWVGKGGSGAFGVLTSSFFAGALLGSLATARYGKRFSARNLIVCSVLAMGLAIVGFSRSQQEVFGVAALATLGVFLTSYNVGVVTLLQRLAPAEAMGRVFAVNETASWSFRAVTLLVCGALADAAGVHAVLLGLGGGMLVLGMAALSTQSLSLREPASLRQVTREAAAS